MTTSAGIALPAMPIDRPGGLGPSAGPAGSVGLLDAGLGLGAAGPLTTRPARPLQARRGVRGAVQPRPLHQLYFTPRS
jgi:hypothetical protein